MRHKYSLILHFVQFISRQKYFVTVKQDIFMRYEYPTGNNVHATCMFHANFINLHAQQNMHVIMLMYMHVSCNMQGFRMFSMHVTCMLHA